MDNSIITRVTFSTDISTEKMRFAAAADARASWIILHDFFSGGSFPKTGGKAWGRT